MVKSYRVCKGNKSRPSLIYVIHAIIVYILFNTAAFMYIFSFECIYTIVPYTNIGSSSSVFFNTPLNTLWLHKTNKQNKIKKWYKECQGYLISCQVGIQCRILSLILCWNKKKMKEKKKEKETRFFWPVQRRQWLTELSPGSLPWWWQQRRYHGTRQWLPPCTTSSRWPQTVWGKKNKYIVHSFINDSQLKLLQMEGAV